MFEKGETAPDFTVSNTEGHQVRLFDYKNKKNVTLISNCGSQWLYCRKHMAQLRQGCRQCVGRNTEVIAVGPEESKVFKQWWDEHQMPFIGIADPGHVIADDYGQQVKLIKLGRMPATILIDKQGIIRYTHFGESMSDIPATDEMLEIIDSLNTK